MYKEINHRYYKDFSEISKSKKFDFFGFLRISIANINKKWITRKNK